MGDTKKNYPNFHDSYLRQYIQQADTKASWLFAANSAVLIWIIANQDFKRQILLKDSVVIYYAIIIMAVSFLLSCGFLINVIRPRSVGSLKSGVVYFRDVASFRNSDAYICEVERRTDEELFHDRLRSQYAMSKICSRKYRWLNAASFLSVVAFSLAILLHLWLSFKS